MSVDECEYHLSIVINGFYILFREVGIFAG